MARSESQHKKIKEIYGFSFPDDFFEVWEFATSQKPRGGHSALDELGVFLTGPFDVLSGAFDNYPGPLHPLLHGRFHNDPPEFLTLAFGDSDGSHWGYWYDDRPTNFSVAHYFAHDSYELSHCGRTLFDAFRLELEQRWSSAKDYGDRAAVKRLDKLREKLVKASSDTVSEIGDAYIHKTQTLRHERLNHIVACTREGMGIVAPEETRTRTDTLAVWGLYRLSPAALQVEVERTKELMHQGFFANGLQVGRELWSNPRAKELAADVLEQAYLGLNRPELAATVRLHAKYRWLPTVNILDYASDEALKEAEDKTRSRRVVSVDKAYRVERTEEGTSVFEVEPANDLNEKLRIQYERILPQIPEAKVAVQCVVDELQPWPAILILACERAARAGDFAAVSLLAKTLAEGKTSLEIMFGSAFGAVAATRQNRPLLAEQYLDAIVVFVLDEELNADEEQAAQADDLLENVLQAMRGFTPLLAAALCSRLLADPSLASFRGHYFLGKGVALSEAGDTANAVQTYRDWLKEEPHAPTAWHWLGHLTSGEESRAAYEQARKYYEEEDDDDYAYQVACICAVLGDQRAALKYLKIAIDNEDEALEEAATDRELDSVRDLPAFAKLLRPYVKES